MSHDLQAITTQLHTTGYRMTPQRQLVLQAVCQFPGHATPEEVYQQVQAQAPTIHLSTIYRTLHFLTAQHILTETPLPDGRFGYELAGKPHHHLVCRHCQQTILLPHEAIRPLLDTLAATYNFTIDLPHLALLGLCANCRDQ